MSEFHAPLPPSMTAKQRRSRLILLEILLVFAGVGLVAGFIWLRVSESRRLFTLANSPLAAERVAAAETLSGKRGPKALSMLEILLQDQDAEVRLAAARAFVASLGGDAVARIVAAVEEQRLPVAAVEDLIGGLGAAGLDALDTLARYGPPAQRDLATPMLARLRDRASLDPRVCGLLEADPAERRSAELALQQLGPGADPLLRAGLGASSPELVVRSAALLNKLGLETSAGALLDPVLGQAAGVLDDEIAALAGSIRPPPTGFLVSRLERGPAAVRARSAGLLALLRTREARAPLETIVQDRGDELEVRCAAAVALGRLRDPASVPTLLAVLQREPAGDGVEFPDAGATSSASGLPATLPAALVQSLAGFGGAAIQPALQALKDDPAFEGRARALFIQAGAEAVPALLAELEGEPGAHTQLVIQCLGRIGDPRAADALARRVCGESMEIDRDVAAALAAIGEPAFEPLVGLAGEKDSATRACALESLVEWAKGRQPPSVGNDDRVPGLMIAALKDSAPEVRAKAVSGLAALDARYRWSSVLPLLADPDPTVRAETVRAISQLGEGPQASSALKWSAQDATAEVRIAAFEAIGSRKDVSAAGILVAGLGDESTSWAAREALVRLGEAAVPAIQGGIHHDAAVVRAECVGLLGDIGGPTAGPYLEAGLADSEPVVRAAAVRATAAVGGTDALGRMAAVAGDASPEVRSSLATALGTLNQPGGVGLLLPLVNDAEGAVRASAVEAAATLASPELLKPLIARLGDPSIERDSLVRALVAIGAPAVDPLLAELSIGDDPERSGAILGALGGLRDRRTTQPLLAFLRDEARAEPCAGAIRALGAIGDPEAVPALIAIVAAPEDHGMILEPAVESLGELRDPRAIEVLTPLLETEEESLAMKAAAALESIGGDEAHDALRKAADAGALAVVAGAYRFFMNAGSYDDVLCSALDAHGDKTMAEAFLNSSNGTLSERARAWADANGYMINWEFRTLPGSF